MNDVAVQASRASRGASPVCPLCGEAAPERSSRLGRSYRRCAACGFLHATSGPVTSDDGRTIYEQEDSVFLRDGNERYYLDESNLRSCARKLAWVRRHAPPGARLLDAGANFGHFLKVAAGTYDARGFDISPQAVAWSREHFAVRNQVASIYDLPADLAGPWDVVTCWDVLEHLPDPVTALERLHSLLRPDGLLFLSTPDAGSAVARLLGRHWHYLDPVQHLSLFTSANLRLRLEGLGFRVIERRRLGHYYRLAYVWDRLLQLHRSGPVRAGARWGKRACALAGSWTLYVGLGDVMGIAVRRRAPSGAED